MDRPLLKEITLQDFRCFRAEQTARLAPLTLLVGENSTGKTSFLAGVRAMLNIGHAISVPDFRAAPYDLGSFSEIVHNQGTRRHGSSFGIGIQTLVDTHPPVTFDAVFALGPGAAPSFSTVSWRTDDVWIRYVRGSEVPRVEFGTPNGSWSRAISAEFRSHIPSVIGGESIFIGIMSAIRGSGAAPVEDQRSGGERNVPNEGDIEQLMKLLLNPLFRLTVFASAPIRSSPLRTYDPIRLSPDPEGTYVPSFFASVHFRDPVLWGQLKKSMESFGRNSGLFDEISVKQLGKSEGGPFQLEVRKYGKHRKGAKRNLIDVGYGVSQIIPVLMEMFRPGGAQLMLFQQPEVHLHPSAQAALGTLFCETATAGRQLIVETHSDYIIDRILLDIRDKHGRLQAEDVSILYFEREDANVSIYSLGIDPEGEVLGPPTGYRSFFKGELNRMIDY